jgi:hypothetical protein
LNHSCVICRSGLYFLCHFLSSFLCLTSPSLVARQLIPPCRLASYPLISNS